MFDGSAMSAENYTNTIVGWAKYLYEFKADGGTLPASVDAEDMGDGRTFWTDVDITSIAPAGSGWTTSADARAWLVSTGEGNPNWSDDWGDNPITQP